MLNTQFTKTTKKWTFHLILVMSSDADSVSMIWLSLILEITAHIWICKDQEIIDFIPWQLCHLHFQILRCTISIFLLLFDILYI